ncbi:uncharacterized protein MJAP1_002250 [Malassezia japonica]|uniref:Uncharacterized protein n=1 Tax=Malassezia japonica TaxID=223818 RepID=A0AAF0F2K7_9BASI|nr:uncharacterized protein MJAP1_002250 [Malassezia japonica]WFD39279.1 hypothetical protein MJAP1_002250 [Malassezia japonica]
MQLTTPAYRLQQDAASVTVRVSCAETKAVSARAVAEGTTFGCFMDPVYLPLTFPAPVRRLDVVVSLDAANTVDGCSFDAAAMELVVRLEKEVHGTTFEGLERLQPQILSKTEMQALERDAQRLEKEEDSARSAPAPVPAPTPAPAPTVQFPVGLLCEPLASPAYTALVAAGRIPYMDILDPTPLSNAERECQAEKMEGEKWDEGMYLDSTVDLDGEIAGLLKQRLSFAERSEDIAETRTPAPARAAAFLAQLLFAYLYEDRTSFQDPTPESAWTVCKLTRSIVCWTDPLDLSPGLDATLRASYRRALTYPLYRSTAVCARVCEDAAELLSSAPRTRILHVLHAIDALFALAPTGTGLAEQATTVLRLVWELWIVPLQAWVSHAATDAQLEAVRAAFARHARPTPSFLVEIGTPGDWDLAALDAAAEEARLHGEGEFSDEGQSVQRPRPGTLTAVLEYHRNIARATAVVRNAGADAVVARVLEVPTGVVLSLAAGTAAIDVDLDWPLVAGEYAGEVHGDTQVVTLGAHTSAPYSGMLRPPWAVLATEHIPVLGLGCAACHAALTTFGGAATLRALPSENWEELVDAWMCHGDQRLNASVVQGRADVEPSRTPAADEIWVGTLLLKVASTQLVGVACANTKAQGPWELLQPSIVPIPNERPQDALFAQILAHYFVEQAERHAVHHFLIQELGTGASRLFLWAFQPLVEMHVQRRMVVCKILYHTTHTTPEVPYIPLALAPAHCDQLQALLDESNALLSHNGK